MRLEEAIKEHSRQIALLQDSILKANAEEEASSANKKVTLYLGQIPLSVGAAAPLLRLHCGRKLTAPRRAGPRREGPQALGVCPLCA